MYRADRPPDARPTGPGCRRGIRKGEDVLLVAAPPAAPAAGAYAPGGRGGLARRTAESIAASTRPSRTAMRSSRSTITPTAAKIPRFAMRMAVGRSAQRASTRLTPGMTGACCRAGPGAFRASSIISKPTPPSIRLSSSSPAFRAPENPRRAWLRSMNACHGCARRSGGGTLPIVSAATNAVAKRD